MCLLACMKMNSSSLNLELAHVIAEIYIIDRVGQNRIYLIENCKV